MNSCPKFRRSLVLLALACLILMSIACAIPSLSTPAPTATLPTEVDSALRTNLLGQWRVINGGDWEGAVLTFTEDGGFTVIGGLQEKDDEGSFFFTAQDSIVFSFPDYQGSADIQFMSDDQLNLTVMTSDGSFGVIYSVERVE